MFLYMCILFPIFRISGAFDTLDRFWRENARHDITYPNIVTNERLDEIHCKSINETTSASADK